MSFDIEVKGLKELQESISRFPQVAGPIVAKTILTVANTDVLGQLKQTLPTGLTGQLKNTTHVSTTGAGMSTVSTVQPSVSYAIFADQGRGPGPVSKDGQEAIRLWARRKGHDDKTAKAIVWAIIRRGTKRYRERLGGAIGSFLTGSSGAGVGEWGKAFADARVKLPNRLKTAAKQIAEATVA